MEENKSQSLLIKWIEGELRDYMAPEKKGTPRGEPVGLSSNKYYAILLMLSDVKKQGLKELANKIGVSYGLLRKWRTEKLFKKMVREKHIEYALYAADYIKEQTRQECKEAGVISKGWAMPEFEDINGYSRELQIIIFGTLFTMCRQMNDIILLSNVFLLLRRVLGESDKITHLSKQLEGILSGMIEMIIDYGIEILSKKRLSEKDKKHLTELLIIVKRYIV